MSDSMEVTIDQGRLDHTVQEMCRALEGKNMSNLYVILAAVQVAGRVAVNCANSPLEVKELHVMAMKHLTDTIRIGAEALGKGSNLILPTH